jgi:hypothetical protein
VEEIARVVQFNGLLATNPHDDGDLLIAVTIGFYAMPFPRAKPELFVQTQKVDVVRALFDKKKLSIVMLGIFARHVDNDDKAFLTESHGGCSDVPRVQ